MGRWFTAKELAGLPGLPTTQQGVTRKAKREGWQFRKRAARGGGLEYHISSLPPETRDALLNQAVAELPAPPCTPPAKLEDAALEIRQKHLPAPETLADWQRRTMDARLALLRHVEHLAEMTSLNKAIDKLVALAKTHQLPDHLQQLVAVANARSGGQMGKQTLSRRTLFRWRKDLQAGLTALAPCEPARDRTAPAWGAALLAAWRQPQKPSLAEAVRLVNNSGIQVSYSRARRFLEKVGEVEKQKGRMGAREIKNIKPFRRRGTENLLAGDIYAADGHTFDAEVAHPDHGRPFRPEVTMMVDVATRVIVGWSVALAESSLATIDALRMACEQASVPAILYCDNGSGYKNEMLTAPGTGLLARLGIEMHHSIPYNSQARGIIERAHRSILVGTAKRLPTYIGAPMDRDARQIAFKETRKTRQWLIEWHDFINLVNAAIEEFHHRPHSGLPKIRDAATGTKRHLTPAEMWQRDLDKGWQPVPAGELPDLYHPQMARKVIRGEINLHTRRYFSRDLEQWHGETVFVAYDVHNPAKVWVRDEDQRLICTAGLDANKSDYFPMSDIERAREKRAEGRLKRLDLKREEIELERRGGRQQDVIEVTPEAIEARHALEIEMAQPAASLEIPQDDRGRYRLWCRLNQRVANGEEIAAKEARFYQSFQKTSTWRAFRSTEQELAIAK